MRDRYLAAAVRELSFPRHKITMLSGPRQCGKTTLAKSLLAERGGGTYHNWDQVEFRRIWTKTPSALLPAEGKQVPVLVLDEIHKAPGWKRTLKGLYDTLERPCDIVVTGSARLDVYRKGGDSLLGRHLAFRLHPFSIAELSPLDARSDPRDKLKRLLAGHLPAAQEREAVFAALSRLGGFPEPFLTASDRAARIWRQSRVTQVIREDLRDLTHLTELGKIEMLASLLPERVGSPLSRQALSEVLEVAHPTITRWIGALTDLFYCFELKPWTKAVSRSLRKESKVYLWDWSEVDEPGPRFENLVACHLLKACDYWTDTGEGRFELWYLRNKEKEEIDFLIVRDKRPWLAVEAKLSDTTPSKHFPKFLRYLGLDAGLQLVASPDVNRSVQIGDVRIRVMSAATALAAFV
jgi:uncharacterized protein